MSSMWRMRRSVRFIRQHAGEYGVDPNRIGVFGGSAGGQLALFVNPAEYAEAACGPEGAEPPLGCRRYPAGDAGLVNPASVDAPDPRLRLVGRARAPPEWKPR